MLVGMEVPLPSLRARNPAVPEEVEALVRRALAFDAAERPATAGALADALDEVIRNLPNEAAGAHVPATPAAAVPRISDDDRTVLAGGADDDRTMLAPPPRAPLPPPAAPPRAAPVIPARRPPEPEPRGGAGKILAGGALLLVLGAGGVVAYQQMNSDGDTEPALSELADSARVDSSGIVDTVTIVDAAVLSLEGRRMITEGNFAGAAASFQRALQADPTKAEYRDGYAYALLRMGRAEEAERVLLEAIRIDRDYDLLYSHLADARLARGDTVGAISALERFINLTLDRQDQETARRKLDALTQVQVVVPPAPTIDSTVVAPTPIPADPGAPRDTIRLGPPGR
jgi:hypothetical protein